jgi:SAM-dependent methyltransferase
MNVLQLLTRRAKRLVMSGAQRRHALVGPAHLWQMKRDFQIQFLRRAGLAADHYLLDLGCGTLRGGIPLIGYLDEGHYFGIEARQEVLDEGRRELRDAGLEGKRPVLVCEPRLSQVRIDRTFDFIWAFSVLIHMSDDVLEDALRLVSQRLAPGGVFFANVNIGEQHDGSWQGFPVVSRRAQFYADACARHGLTIADVGSLHEHGHISGQKKQDRQRILKMTLAAAAH